MSRAVGDAYDARAAEYIASLGDVSHRDAEDRELISAWRDSTFGRLLDAGSGPGLWTDFLHDGQRDVLGIDLSERFIAHARSAYPHLLFHRGSFVELPLADASLGGILAWYSLIHTPPEELPAILTEFARVLRSGGSALISFFNGPAREPFAHVITTAYFWSADALQPMLEEAGFTVVATEARGENLSECGPRPHASVTAVRV